MGPRILIIDDDRDLVETLRIILASKGYRISAAHDGQAGWRRIEAEVPDLIVLDVMMATATEGFDLAYRIRNKQEYRAIPILMISACPRQTAPKGPDAFQHILGEDWPVSHFMEKPIDPEVLLAVVADLLARLRIAPRR